MPNCQTHLEHSELCVWFETNLEYTSLVWEVALGFSKKRIKTLWWWELQAAIVWTIWKFRNVACFKNKKKTKDPLELIYVVCSWINLWSILQRSGDTQDRLQREAALLKTVVTDFYNTRFGWNPYVMRIQGVGWRCMPSDGRSFFFFSSAESCSLLL